MAAETDTSESHIVVAGIVAVFILFIITLVVPFIDIFPLVLPVIVGLMAVIFFLKYFQGNQGTKCEKEQRNSGP